MPLKLFRKGTSHDVLAYCKGDGQCQVEEFIDRLEERDRKKMLARVAYSGDYEPPRNRGQNKVVEGTRYFEFKTDGVRLFWRWSRNHEIILMHAFLKRQDRIPPAEVETANTLYGLIEKELDELR